MAKKETKVIVSADTSKYERGMRNIKRSSKSASQIIAKHWKTAAGATVAAAAAVAGLGAVITKTLDAGDKLHKLNLSTKISVEALSEFQHVAELSGISFDSMTMSLTRMTKRVSEAAGGYGSAKKVIEELNINAANLTKLAPAKQLNKIADAIKGVDNESDKLRMTMAIFGITGAKMGQVMADGSAGIDKMRRRAQQLGLTMTKEMVDKMAAANDAIADLKSSGKGLATMLATALAPDIKKVADKMTDWVTQNRELIQQKLPEHIEEIGKAAKGFLGTLGQIYSSYTKIQKVTSKLMMPKGSFQDFYKEAPADIADIFKAKQPIHFYPIPQQDGTPPKKSQKPKNYQLPLLDMTGDDAAAANYKNLLAEFNALGVSYFDKQRKAVQEQREEWESFNLDKTMIAEVTAARLTEIAEAEAAQRKEIEDQAAAEKKKLETQAAFYLELDDLGKSWFEVERDRIKTLDQEWAAADIDKIDRARMTSALMKEIAKDEFDYRVSQLQGTTAAFASNFKTIADQGGKHAEEAFKMWQAFKVLETTMATYSMAVKAYESLVWVPGVGPALATAAAITATTFGMAQVAAITAMKPPSYDQGGVSTTPGVYYAGVPEAHIPLQSGKVPVQIQGSGGEQTIIVKMENPVFQDIATQKQVFAQIAEVISTKIAPKAVLDNYNNDGAIRRMVGR